MQNKDFCRQPNLMWGNMTPTAAASSMLGTQFNSRLSVNLLENVLEYLLMMNLLFLFRTQFCFCCRIPLIDLRNPKGLSDRKVKELQEQLVDVAKTRVGEVREIFSI